MLIAVKAPNGKSINLEDGRGSLPTSFLEASMRGDFASPGDIRQKRKPKDISINTTRESRSPSVGDDAVDEIDGFMHDKDRQKSSRRALELRKNKGLLNRCKENRTSNLGAAGNQTKRKLRRRKGNTASAGSQGDDAVGVASSTRLERKERHMALKKIKADDRIKKRMLIMLSREPRKVDSNLILAQ